MQICPGPYVDIHMYTHAYIYRYLWSTHYHTNIYSHAWPYLHMYIVICLYTYICTHIRGTFNKFLDFFVQAFKIIVDFWQYSTLLLCILWDDSLIFMISASNEQLQQQLEYTLLKSDCHSWWSSKMQSDTLEERYAMKFYFKLAKNATETTYGILQTAFGASCMNRASVFE